MPFEVLIDSHSSPTNSEGIPYNEIFTQKEGRRLDFEVYRTEGSDLIDTDAKPEQPLITVPTTTSSPRRRNTPINTSGI